MKKQSEPLSTNSLSQDSLTALEGKNKVYFFSECIAELQNNKEDTENEKKL